MQVLNIFVSWIFLLVLSLGAATVPRERLVLRHEKFNLKLIRPLSHENTVSFLETDEITLSKTKTLGSGAFGTVWMCEIQIDSEKGEFDEDMPRVVAAKIMNHIPSAEEIEAATTQTEGECAGPDVWPVPILQMVNSFFREAAFAKAIESNSDTRSMIGKNFVHYYGLHFLSEDASGSVSEDDSVMTVQSEGTNEQMAVLLMEIMSNMDDLTCVPSRTKMCHWELTKFVSAPALRDQFVEHGKKITRSLLSAVDVLGKHGLVHHDIWEDNVVVRAQFNEATDSVEYSALLIDFGVSIDCNHVPFKTEVTTCPSSSKVLDEASEKLPRPRSGSLGSDTTLTIDPNDSSRRGIRRAVSAPSIPNAGFLAKEYKDLMIQKYGTDPLVLKLREKDRVNLRRVVSSEPHLEFEDEIAYAYSDERCCTNLFRGFFNSYFSRHDPELVESGVHSSGMRVCRQWDKNEDKAKMDKIMVLIMLEKILNLQFGEPRWLDEEDGLEDKIKKPIHQASELQREFKWLIGEICRLRKSLHFHESDPVIATRRGLSVFCSSR